MNNTTTAHQAEPLFLSTYARLNEPLSQKERIASLQNLVVLLPALWTPSLKERASVCVTNLVWRLVEEDASEELALAAVDVLHAVVNLRGEDCKYIVELCVGWVELRWPQALRIKAFGVLEIMDVDRWFSVLPGVSNACVTVLNGCDNPKICAAALKSWRRWICCASMLSCRSDSANIEEPQALDASHWTSLMLASVFRRRIAGSFECRKALVEFFDDVLKMPFSLDARKTCADCIATLAQTDVAEDACRVLRRACKEQGDLRTGIQKHLVLLLKSATSALGHEGKITLITGYLRYLREVCEPLVYIDDMVEGVLLLCRFSKPNLFADQHALEISEDYVHKWLHHALQQQGPELDAMLHAFAEVCDNELLLEYILDYPKFTVERAYALAIWTKCVKVDATLIDVALRLSASEDTLEQTVALFLMRNVLRVLDTEQVARLLFRLFIPLLSFTHMVPAHAATCVLEELHRATCGESHHALSCLLSENADIVVNDLTMRLKFNGGRKDNCAPKLTLVVVTHMSDVARRYPFFKEITQLLLRLDTDDWVLESLAHISLELLHDVPRREHAKETISSPLLQYFQSGTWETKGKNRLPYNLEECVPQRTLASQILHRAKHHLCDPHLPTRHFAHLCIERCIVVLSSSDDALLPCVASMIPYLRRAFEMTDNCEKLRIASLQIVSRIIELCDAMESASLEFQLSELIPVLCAFPSGARWDESLVETLIACCESCLVSESSTPKLVRYAAKLRNVRLLRALVPLNVGLVRSMLDRLEPGLWNALEPVPRQARIELTPWSME